MQLIFLLEVLKPISLPFLHLISSLQHTHTQKHLAYTAKSTRFIVKRYQFKFQIFCLMDY